MIALVTVAVFIYRKPFTHLFSAVGYGALGSDEQADYSLREARSTFRRNTLDAAAVAIPGMAGTRAAARWARRIPAQGVAAGAAAAAPTRPPEPAPGPRPEPAPGRGGRRRVRLTVPARSAARGGRGRRDGLGCRPRRHGRRPVPGQGSARGRGQHRAHPAAAGPAAQKWRQRPGQCRRYPGARNQAPGHARAYRVPVAGHIRRFSGRCSGPVRAARRRDQRDRRDELASGCPLLAAIELERGGRQAGPGSAPWQSAGQQSAGPTAPPAEPPHSNGNGSGQGSGSGEPKAMPFWLRPRRRK